MRDILMFGWFPLMGLCFGVLTATFALGNGKRAPAWLAVMLALFMVSGIAGIIATVVSARALRRRIGRRVNAEQLRCCNRCSYPLAALVVPDGKDAGDQVITCPECGESRELRETIAEWERRAHDEEWQWAKLEREVSS